MEHEVDGHSLGAALWSHQAVEANHGMRCVSIAQLGVPVRDAAEEQGAYVYFWQPAYLRTDRQCLEAHSRKQLGQSEKVGRKKTMATLQFLHWQIALVQSNWNLPTAVAVPTHGKDYLAQQGQEEVHDDQQRLESEVELASIPF